MRGWLGPTGWSWGLGLRHLRSARLLPRGGDPAGHPDGPEPLPRAAADDRRCCERAPGERVLDLASPKLAAVALAREGVDVTSVDQLPEEIEKWRSIARDEPAARAPRRRRASFAVR